MRVEFVALDGARAVFRALDADLALVNALRRVILADVPYVALAQDGFVFRKNTGVLHDHMLWHRLTLAPLHASRGEADAYVPGSIKVALQVGNADARAPRDVTTADLRVTLHDQPHPDRDRLYPPHPGTGDHVLLTVLKPGEDIDVSGTVVKGTAAEHAAFAVASTVAFRPLLDDARVAAGRAEADSRGPQALNRFEHIDRKRLWTPGPDGAPRDHEFTVVSECGMSALDIVQSALDVLERKCALAKGTLGPQGTAPVTVLTVPGEGATLGNLLQSVGMDDLWGDGSPAAPPARGEPSGPKKPVREGAGGASELPPRLTFVGWNCDHPLERRVHFKIAADDPAACFQAMKDGAVARIKAMAHEVAEAAARFQAGTQSTR